MWTRGVYKGERKFTKSTILSEFLCLESPQFLWVLIESSQPRGVSQMGSPRTFRPSREWLANRTVVGSELVLPSPEAMHLAHSAH